MHSLNNLLRPRQTGDNYRRTGNTRTSGESPQVAYAIQACSRCRNRKTRCDTVLPRCAPCERSNEPCVFYDASKGKDVPRSYVVHLQDKLQLLEAEFRQLESEESAEADPETMMRAPTAVSFRDVDESKYLGPSSGIAITRLVMQLAKQCTATGSIKEIISHAKARQVKDRFEREQAKPTSKVFPWISCFPETELPNRDLAEGFLIRLYITKVQYMYPLLHEPSFAKDVYAVYAGSTDPYQNFVLRMVIAISLQKMEPRFAGLADSYYLAALPFLEPVVKMKNLKTLQCYGLMGVYSELTPTRTALYFVIGLAVRLCQTLGFTEEHTIVQGDNGQRADPLEIDMRRRLVWTIMVMEYGLAHCLGRPALCATRPEHFDVAWFEKIDDQYITARGILRGTYSEKYSAKKWIAIHFFKMRMLGLEIIMKLYLKKRPEPQDSNHPWFHQMEERLYEWQHESPENDEGCGYSSEWFEGRMNTMIILMYRPCPQVPRPSAQAALKCYKACKSNIVMCWNQIQSRSVDLTWGSTLTLFSNINTVLWSLSYSEVRERHSREEVKNHLRLCLESVEIASERWPGVESALELYHILIEACLKVYDKAGDIPISASSPSDNPSPATSCTEPTLQPRTRSEFGDTPTISDPGSEKHGSYGSCTPSQPNWAHLSPVSSIAYTSPLAGPSRSSIDSMQDAQYACNLTMPFDPQSLCNPLPTTFSDIVNWNPAYATSSLMPGAYSHTDGPQYQNYLQGPMDEHDWDSLQRQLWAPQAQPIGSLSYTQQSELMEALETQATMANIANQIAESEAQYGRLTYRNYQT